jgi:hypothetical protein
VKKELKKLYQEFQKKRRGEKIEGKNYCGGCEIGV